MNSEIYLHIAAAHLSDSMDCADNASKYLFNLVRGEKALEFVARINKALGEISNIRADIEKAIALGEIEEQSE